MATRKRPTAFVLYGEEGYLILCSLGWGWDDKHVCSTTSQSIYLLEKLVYCDENLIFHFESLHVKRISLHNSGFHSSETFIAYLIWYIDLSTWFDQDNNFKSDELPNSSSKLFRVFLEGPRNIISSRNSNQLESEG